MLDAADLPDDIAALKALLIAARSSEADKDAQLIRRDEQIARKDERIERLEKLVAAFKQAAFGRKPEKIDPDQFGLALEDLERPWPPSMPRMRRTPLRQIGLQSLARSIAACFQNILPVSKR